MATSEEAFFCIVRARQLHRLPRMPRLLRPGRTRWNIEQYFQRAKIGLGVDPFAGRGWRSVDPHMLLAALACLFLTVGHLRVRENLVSLGSGHSAG